MVEQNRPGTELDALLSRKISEIALQIPGTRLEQLILELYVELDRAGITFRPRTYLSDEWGCPDCVPVIGIPFYLADQQLSQLEGQFTDVEAEDETEVMMYLRHEAGHAFNYAYRLYRKPGWRQLFGPFSKPYKKNFRPHPFSTRFVHHIPGWYAQKHPDEDFAETFAVWLTPDSNWKKRYAGTHALSKLEYVDRAARQHGRQPPLVTDGTLDAPVEELSMTLHTWYEANEDGGDHRLALHPIIDDHLKKLFPDAEGQPAVEVLEANRRGLIQDVNQWTGIDRDTVSTLYSKLRERVKSLGLKTDPGQTTSRIANLAVLMTTLATNYGHSGQFMEK